MSKVNCYLDSKQKARHRMRRYETVHKKLTRARKSDRGEYSRFYGQCGYFVVRQKERLTHTFIVKGPGGRADYYPQFEPIGGEVFIVRHCSITARYCKRIAARKFRRNKKFDEDSYLLKGSKYKKDFDLPWTVV